MNEQELREALVELFELGGEWADYLEGKLNAPHARSEAMTLVDKIVIAMKVGLTK